MKKNDQMTMYKTILNYLNINNNRFHPSEVETCSRHFSYE